MHNYIIKSGETHLANGIIDVDGLIDVTGTVKTVPSRMEFHETPNVRGTLVVGDY